MSITYSSQIIGMGDNRRGPQVQPVPYPPNPGDGDNTRGATKPENIPAGMYGQVPPPNWKDTGIPGVFTRDPSPFYKIDPPKFNEAKLSVLLNFGKPNDLISIPVEASIRFNQYKVIEDLKVDGITPIDVTPMPTVRALVVSVVEGSGTISVNSGVPLDANNYVFFNFSGGITEVVFDGVCAVDVILFQ